MRLILAACLALSAVAAWAQRDGEPSPAVREQQRQADYARKQHPKSGKSKPQEAAVKTKDKAKAARTRQGETGQGAAAVKVKP